MSDWEENAIKEMHQLKPGSIIWQLENGCKYHVRGIVDDWLVVRYFSGRAWYYKCISPAEFSIFKAANAYKIKVKK